MHKHLQHLERISQKMQFRYGDSDDVVMQLKHEFKSFEAKASNNSADADQSRHDKEGARSFAGLRSAGNPLEAM